MPEKIVYYTKIFERTRNSHAFVVINVGGARSSKSYSIAQVLIEKLVTEQHKKIGICRKTFPALRMTSMQLILDLLKEYGIYQDSKHNKTFNTYDYGTNRIQFFGLDESEKIKSTGFNYIWMEEANEFTYEDYTNLKLRLSEPVQEGQMNHLFLSLNPIDAHNWIPIKAAKESDVEIIHSTYKDNPTLSPEYVKALTDLINQDENFYRVYALGEWGVVARRIYTHYKVIPTLPEMEGAHWAYGLDFGFGNPSAIVRVFLNKGIFYVEERLYKEGLTNPDIIEFLNHEVKGEVYADPSAKMLVQEISKAGINISEGNTKVKDGIDICQRNTIYITEDSPHLITEIQNYQWKVDNHENILPEPVKFRDHAVDAMRYAIVGITERFGFATARPLKQEPIRTLHFRQPAKVRW